MSVYTTTYGPYYPGGGGTVVNAWSGSFAGTGITASVAPLAVALGPASSVGGGSGEPAAGNWLLALCSWRQDAGVAGVLQYPSTVNVRDDVHNFWIPVSVTTPQTGIVRVGAWMAPAARAPEYVFAANTAFQPGITVLILEVSADVPWYQVSVLAQAVTNQGTGVTASFTPPSGVFCAGILTWDKSTAAPAVTATGWTAQPVVTASNGADHTGDLNQHSYAATSGGGALTLTAASGGTADYSVILVSVHGIADAIAFPYQGLLELPNWPALVTEMACGQVLNANQTFSTGFSPWTALNATLASSPLYTFGGSAQSLAVTPTGVTPGAQSEFVQGIVAGSTYTLTVWLTVPAGWSGGATAEVFWYTAGLGLTGTTVSPVTTLTGSQQQITVSGIAPALTTQAQVTVALNGSPPLTTVTYYGYASLALAGALGAVPEDELNWTDLSARTITQEGVKIGRTIQYEQQSLEAGTLEMPFANNDGYLTAGNVFSPYYPYAGQTDVPVRMRAVWPASITPYAPLFSGYSDDVKVEWSDETQYGYVILTASDCWSRLTAQMLTAVQEEFLADIAAGSAGGFWPLNDLAGAPVAANLAPTSLPPLVQVVSKNGSGNVNHGFGSTGIPLAGDPGGTGWFQNSLTTADQAVGYSLALIPPESSALPALSGGVTVEFWLYLSPVVTGIAWDGQIAVCIGAKGRVWALAVGAPAGGNPGAILFTVYDKTTGSGTTTVIDSGPDWNTTHFFGIVTTQTTWSVYENAVLAASGTCNFAAVYNGFVFNGQNVPWQGLGGDGFNGGLQDIALYPLALPATRMQVQYDIALNAAVGSAPMAASRAGADTDYMRVPYIVSYGGFVPPLAMRSLDLPALTGTDALPIPDIDLVTAATDTVGQVVSAYLTNIASSTLAVMFIDGTGALVYRRRLEWYNRPAPQWILGEHAPQALNAGSNFAAISNWTAQNGATLTGFTDSSDTLPPQFTYAGLWHGNGSTAQPQLEYSPADSIAVTPGQSYQFLTWWYSPQGYATGVTCSIQWRTSGGSTISASASAATGLAAGSETFITVTGQAPAGAAHANLFLEATATPASAVQFYSGYAALTVSPGEAPYLRDIRLSDDRAQMFNQAVLNQSGTGTRTTFTGTDLNFAPTSGIQVTVTNQASASQRGPVPYTATVYLANSVQDGSPNTWSPSVTVSGIVFQPSDGSIEDLGSWITQTLGTPVLRGEQVTLTPGATWQDMITALQAEIGDTVVLNRRPLGAPPLSQVLYLSSISHEINISDETQPWVTTYQLSPAPSASVLQCDSPVNGVLDGTSLLGW